MLPDTARGGPAKDRLHTSPDATLTDPADISALLALSDERDRWTAWVLAAGREGYQRGLRAGYDAGYAQAVTDWKVTAAGMTHLGGPSFAELDRRRYPPGGRLSWIIPRPGEADGGEAA